MVLLYMCAVEELNMLSLHSAGLSKQAIFHGQLL
jgi:hypothetical protein